MGWLKLCSVIFFSFDPLPLFTVFIYLRNKLHWLLPQVKTITIIFIHIIYLYRINITTHYVKNCADATIKIAFFFVIYYFMSRHYVVTVFRWGFNFLVSFSVLFLIKLLTASLDNRGRRLLFLFQYYYDLILHRFLLNDFQLF